MAAPSLSFLSCWLSSSKTEIEVLASAASGASITRPRYDIFFMSKPAGISSLASMLETVGSLALPEVDELLHRALLDPNHEVRLRAIRSVEQRPSPEWEGDLVDQLGDPEFGGRPDAVRVLGRIGTPQALEAVIKNLDTPDRKLREALTDVLAAKA